jgi:hypothetical protein
MKVCSVCGEEKPWSEYHKDRTTKSGHDHRCKPCKRRLRQEHYKKPEVKARAAKNMSVYRKKNKDKVQARNKVHYHIKVGNMTRPTHCSKCKAECYPEAHHEDYSKPLDVTWLCNSCHIEVHLAEQEQA